VLKIESKKNQIKSFLLTAFFPVHLFYSVDGISFQSQSSRTMLRPPFTISNLVHIGGIRSW